MRLLTIPADANPSFSKLSLSLATTPEEVTEVQRLRYKVFIESMGLSALSNPEGLDKDDFDAYCDHLIVRDSKTLKVVGTYRILGPNAAREIGRYYSETEFDLSRLQHIRGSIAEAGRACIHPDYRSGAVIMMLWAGLAAYMRRERCSHLIGCASISLTDGGQNAAAIYRSLTERDFCPLEYRVTPHVPFPLDEIDTSNVEVRIPPLLKGYLRAGAWVCGDPAWDPDFHSADLFVMLPLANLDGRYARHYGTGE
ncbi:GNAT family N-acetyltransferase [Undibacterium oligocarboniphilum]|uniref:L-ornithine N(alpha)-acyltransferase n=1 Tax=Undibacterium oligocarboniphilum TaxID=666702 RepID=A0A850QMI6_9BURK|nr:GNAT family N-acyltransferase [Undibacterium oligocarboniphilum]MBC3871338.1 GNAT family N-acetyltransferase [Undibacterium oligocarboniphilum]NVO78835.1 GNAT family N-acetyltransferase [Undibacterium oligocarboniphilum]